MLGDRRLAALGMVLAMVSYDATARAEGVCDPAGHFCVHIDTTSASVCDLLRPGGLDPDTCSMQDVERRERARASSPRPLRALTVRFDDWWTLTSVTRMDAGGEIGADVVASQGRRVRAAIEPQADSIDDFAAPSVRRIHEVQTIWFDTLAMHAGNRAEQIDVEVRAADATYDLAFYGPPGPRLHAFAENALATLDALPAKTPHGPGEAITWIVRGLVIAGILAVIGWWLGKRRNRRGMDARDLWPH